MYHEIKLENYLPKQRQSDNGAIPYQVHEYELVKIIENQVAYYPFLGQQTEVEYENDEGEFKTESEYKIQALFKFRIPYYVGTLAKRPGWRNEDGMLTKTDTVAKNSWVVRKSDEKVTPWNFSEVVDKEASAVNFIERMTALMSRLWTGFFGTERYRTPKIFQNPDFSLKRRDFWVFL